MDPSRADLRRRRKLYRLKMGVCRDRYRNYALKLRLVELKLKYNDLGTDPALVSSSDSSSDSDLADE